MPPVAIRLTDEEIAAAQRLAEATYERFKEQPGSYGNSAAKHLVGKLGEIGVEKYLASLGLTPDAAFRDPDRWKEPDLLLGDDGIEVKSWRPDTWRELGRCVTPRQAKRMHGRARVVVWTTVDERDDGVTVTIEGWSTPADVVSTDPRPTGRSQVLNHQVAEADVRDLAGLPEHLGVGAARKRR